MDWPVRCTTRPKNKVSPIYTCIITLWTRKRMPYLVSPDLTWTRIYGTLSRSNSDEVFTGIIYRDC